MANYRRQRVARFILIGKKAQENPGLFCFVLAELQDQTCNLHLGTSCTGEQTQLI
jgi:hypothetical protein